VLQITARATAAATEYDLDVLVGVRFTSAISNGMALYHIEGPAVSPPIKTFDCIGVGRMVARQAMSLFYRDSLTVQEASRVGVYCVKQTKDHVGECGGPSQIMMLWDDAEEIYGPTAPYSVEQDHILEIEGGFAALFEALRPVFLSFNNVHPWDSSFTKHLREAAKTIKKIWSKTYGSILKREKEQQEEMRRLFGEQGTPHDT
jgi:hypothetical protein